MRKSIQQSQVGNSGIQKVTLCLGNSDGSVTNRQARYGVYTSSRYHSDDIVKDYSVLARATQYPNDWKNVEMTGQTRFNSG
jgi:hypothetical protein